MRETVKHIIVDIQDAGDIRYAPIAKGVTNGDSHNHVGGDGATITTPMILIANGLNTTVPASTTDYISPPMTSHSTLLINALTTIAGTLKNFYVRIGTAQPASGSLDCTLYVNNVATTITFSIAAGASAGNYSDTTHSVSVSAGDRFTFELKNNATGASAGITACVIELDANNI